MKVLFFIVLVCSSLFISHLALANSSSALYLSSDWVNLVAVLVVAGVIGGGFIYKQCARRRKQMNKENIHHDA